MSLERIIAEKVTKEIVNATCDGVTTIGKNLADGVEAMLDGGGPEDLLAGLIIGGIEVHDKFCDGVEENVTNFLDALSIFFD